MIRRARVHDNACSYLKSRQDTPTGRWHGPFQAIDDGLGVRTRMGDRVLPCGHCLPQGPAGIYSDQRHRPPVPTIRAERRIPNGQVDHLIVNLDNALDAFENRPPFLPRQVNAHRQTIAKRRAFTTVDDLLEDEPFFSSLLETLRAWRMGSRGAVMRTEMDIWSACVRERDALNRLWSVSLDEVSDDALPEIQRETWGLIDRIRVGARKSNLVAASKTLHHVLPDLIPPIDRKYTLRFFGINSPLAEREPTYFGRVFPGFHRIAREGSAILRSRVGEGMHTSISKVIDNAVVGYDSMASLDAGRQ